LHQLGTLAGLRVVLKILPSEFFVLQSFLYGRISLHFLGLFIQNVELLEMNLFALDSSPNEIDAQLQSLGQELSSYDANVA
jgi:hypothetical protein